MMKLRISRLFMVVAIAIALLSAGFGPRIRVWAGERYHSGRPTQYSDWTMTDRTGGYGAIVAIGHNAGNDPATAQRAIASGAAYIEIDVVFNSGNLYAAHNRPDGIVSGVAWWVAPPLTLRDAWLGCGSSVGIELDIKENSPEALQQVVAFLKREWDGHRPLVLASKDPDVLATMADQVPAAFRVLSVDGPTALAAFQKGGGSSTRIDGVTIHETLLNPESMAWFKHKGLLVLAWTVNDPVRFDQLAGLGVDGVATDNLAIAERSRNGGFAWSR